MRLHTDKDLNSYSVHNDNFSKKKTYKEGNDIQSIRCIGKFYPVTGFK